MNKILPFSMISRKNRNAFNKQPCLFFAFLFLACFFFAFVILFCLSVFFLFNCVCEFVLLCKPKPVLKNQRKSGTQTFAMLSLIGFKVNLMNRVGGQFFCLTFSNITSCCPSYSRNERGN